MNIKFIFFTLNKTDYIYQNLNTNVIYFFDILISTQDIIIEY